MTKPTITIRQAQTDDFDVALQLLHEYFEAIRVVVRDEPKAVSEYIKGKRSAIWLAYVENQPAGCIIMRPLPSIGSTASEVKRLYVRPNYRRLGIASQLLTALEAFACANGIETLYLDSKDDLREAIAFYKRSGYEVCERFNDNPQATIFMRKSLVKPISLREFQPGDEEAFWSLNEAWISKLFKLEGKDFETLRHPREHILDKGGRIYFACRGNQQVGCCALLNMGDGSFELAKMGVAESERGRGIGRLMLQFVKSEARRNRVRRIYLETNHSLKNAIHLYEAVGFVHLNPENVKPSPYARSDVYMELLLGSSDES